MEKFFRSIFNKLSSNFKANQEHSSKSDTESSTTQFSIEQTFNAPTFVRNAVPTTSWRDRFKSTSHEKRRSWQDALEETKPDPLLKEGWTQHEINLFA